MNILSFVAFAGLNIPPHMIAVLVPLAGITLAGVIVVSQFYFKHQQQKQWHETARLALEKGQPVPSPFPDENARGAVTPQLSELAVEQAQARRIRGLLLAGFINIALGTGLFIALHKIARDASLFATIPGFVGIALVMAAFFEPSFWRKPGK